MTGPVSAASTWVALRPFDTVHVRDGRPFPGGQGGHAASVRPLPSTVAGAIAAACGRERGGAREPAAVRGPVLVRETVHGWTPFFPFPRDVQAENARADKFVRLAPPQADDPAFGVRTDLDTPLLEAGHQRMLPLLPPPWIRRPAPVDLVLSGNDLARYLHGQVLHPKDERVNEKELNTAADPLAVEERVGLAIGDDRTARIGALYRTTHLRLGESWAFAAECDGLPVPVEELAGPVRFGGLGRTAEVLAPPGLSWPARPEEFPGGRVLLYVATPAVWAGGWLPPLWDGGRPDDVELVAAAVGEAQAVSTASPRRGRGGEGKFQRTSVLLTAVPAGSVYLLRFSDPGRALEWARRHHGRALGPAAHPRFDTAGFGVVLTGVWS